MKDMTEEEDALRTRTPHTLVKSCITNEDSTYTRQVIHRYALVKSCITNEDSTCIHSSSHALRTRTPHTLVKSYVTNEDSKHTRQVMHYERGLHMYTLVKSYITNEDSTCIHLSSHLLRTRTQHTLVNMDYERGLHMYILVKSYITNEVSPYTGQVGRTRTPIHSCHALRMHRRWPTSSPAVNWTMPVRLTTWPQ